jgi:putative ABC transport system permease protein
MAMIHSFRLFARNLGRHKLFSFINITGLAFGVGFIILIGQFLYFEYGYNRFYDNIDHLYRLVDAKENSYEVDYRVRDAILEAVPEIKNACLLNRFSVEVNHGNHVYEFENMLVVDSAFFEVFGVRFVQGVTENAFNTVDNVVLTETAARRIFGETNPLGQRILLRHEYEMNVTGVVKDFPNNSSFQADLLVSAENTTRKRLSPKMACEHYDGKDDGNTNFFIFVELHPQTTRQFVEERISSLLDVGDYRFEQSELSRSKRITSTTSTDSDLAHGNPGRQNMVIGLLIWRGGHQLCEPSTAGYKYRLTETAQSAWGRAPAP